MPCAEGGSRSFCDRMDSWAKKQGKPGLGYIFWKDGAGMGRLPTTSGQSGRSNPSAAGPEDGDAAFFTCDKPLRAKTFSGTVRNEWASS